MEHSTQGAQPVYWSSHDYLNSLCRLSKNSAEATQLFCDIE